MCIRDSYYVISLSVAPHCASSFIGVGQVYLPWFLLAGEAVVLWIIVCYIQRYLLKALLMYKGWMFDPRG